MIAVASHSHTSRGAQNANQRASGGKWETPIGRNDLVMPGVGVLQTVCKGVWEAIVTMYGYDHRDKDVPGIHSGTKLYIRVLSQRKGPGLRPASSLLQCSRSHLNNPDTMK